MRMRKSAFETWIEKLKAAAAVEVEYTKWSEQQERKNDESVMQASEINATLRREVYSIVYLNEEVRSEVGGLNARNRTHAPDEHSGARCR